MAEAATSQLFRDNDMNIWHGLAASSMSAFFIGSRSSRAPSWRLSFLTNAQSTTRQSGGEFVGVYAAKFCHLKQKAGAFFFG